METALHRLREARQVELAAQLERERHEAALCPVRFEHNVGVAADGRWFFWRAGKHGMCAGWTPERERIRFLAPFEQLAARVLQVEPDWRHPDAPAETP